MRLIVKFFLFILLTPTLTTPAIAQKIVKISAPPSFLIQEDGDKMTGPIVNLLTEFFSEFDVEVISKKLPWARAVEHMESGHLDLIPLIFHTQEREKSMAFSVPYFKVDTVVFVAKGKGFPFKKAEDLIGRRGLILRNESISPEFNTLRPKLNLTVISTYESIFKMLLADRADYAVSTDDGFLVESNRLGFEEMLEILPVPISSRGLHMAISKKSLFLNYLPKLNNQLQKMQSNGTMKLMLDRALKQAAGE